MPTHIVKKHDKNFTRFFNIGTVMPVKEFMEIHKDDPALIAKTRHRIIYIVFKDSGQLLLRPVSFFNKHYQLYIYHFTVSLC